MKKDLDVVRIALKESGGGDCAGSERGRWQRRHSASVSASAAAIWTHEWRKDVLIWRDFRECDAT